MSSTHLNTKNRYDPMVHLRVDTEADGCKCKISIVEKRGDKAPTEQYVPHKIDMSKIRLLSQDIYHILDSSSISSGSNNFSAEKHLRDAGHDLYHYLFPLQIKEKLAKIRSRNLLLIIHDSLVGIPWESLYDGKEFFCLRFNMGRSIYTSHPIPEKNFQAQQKKIKMSILADPTYDLPRSYDEGLDLYRNLVLSTDLLDISFDTRDINISKVSRQLFYFDILHYAGHAIYNRDESNLCGWCLKDGLFTPQQIMQLSGGQSSFPSLIFANACQSGRTDEWSEMQPNELNNHHAFDLVNAFLRCGVRHYIGTFGCIPDPFSFSMSLNFYNLMLKSYSIGDSLRQTRIRMIKKHGKNNLIWAHYVLYGHPSTCYFRQKEEKRYRKNEERRRKKASPDNKKQVQNSRDDARGGLSGNKRSITRTKDRRNDEKVSHTFKDKVAFNQEEERRDRKKRQIIPLSKKWGKRIAFTFGIGVLLLFLFAGIIIIAGILIRPPQYLPLERLPDFENLGHMDIDLAWENKKWEIIEDIQEKMNKHFIAHAKKEKILSDSADIVQLPHDYTPNSEVSSITKFSLCILPEIPVGKDTIIDKWATKKLIGEFIPFFSRKTNYVVVERDRLDFVLQELQRATSDLSEDKLKFTLGKIFGARGILFVLALKPPDNSYIPFLNNKTDVYLRLVDTETTAIRAAAERSIEIKNLKKESRHLAEEILLLLEKDGQ